MKIELDQAVTLAMAATSNSGNIDVSRVAHLSIAVNVVELTATVGGTLKLQGSADGVEWEDVPSQTMTVSGAGTDHWDLANCTYRYLRLSWTRTGGDGTATCYFFGKG
jgi:hypothetical protein